MLSSPIVVFDLGEVLVPSSGVLPVFAAELDVAGDRFAAAYWPPRPDYDLGGDPEAYWTAVLATLDTEPEPELLGRLCDHDAARWSDLPAAGAALIDGLAAGGTRLGLLSNAPTPLADAVRAAAWSDPFDVLVFSADVSLVKPDPAIYAAADERYGTAPSDVVFFDDRVENVEAARTHGWNAHVWAGPTQRWRSSPVAATGR